MALNWVDITYPDGFTHVGDNHIASHNYNIISHFSMSIREMSIVSALIKMSRNQLVSKESIKDIVL